MSKKKTTESSEEVLKHKVGSLTVLMLITSILTLITAFAGVFHSRIYTDLITQGLASNFTAAGAVNQDILSIVCGLGVLVLSVLIFRTRNYKLLIVALGLMGYIFYSYAVYTFGAMLTPLYLAYIATFVLSVYSLIIGFLSFDSSAVRERLVLSAGIRGAIGSFLILMTAVLSLKWIMDILGESFKQTQPELYLIAAMDLGFALPAFAVSAVMILRNSAYGILFSGVALIKIFTLCLSVSLGTFIAPYFSLTADYGSLGFFSFLAIISLLLIVLFIKKLRITPRKLCIGNDAGAGFERSVNTMENE